MLVTNDSRLVPVVATGTGCCTGADAERSMIMNEYDVSQINSSIVSAIPELFEFRVTLAGSGRFVRLDMIRTFVGCRRRGYAERALRLLCEWADTHGVTLVTTPEPADTDQDAPRAAMRAWLREWYERHGFVNKARSDAEVAHEVSITDEMIRTPFPSDRFVLLTVEDEPLYQPHGCSAGDAQIGGEWSRQATWFDRHERNYVTVTVTGYVEVTVYGPVGDEGQRVVMMNDSGEDYEDWPNWHAGHVPDDEGCVELREWAGTELVRHTHFGDPGSTEIGSDVETEAVGYVFQSTLEKAEAIARNHVAGIDFARDIDPSAV